jgi:hypothetical protein
MLKLIVTKPFQCGFLSATEHMPDGDMEVHSYPDSAIKIPEDREKGYIAWEYEEIGRRLPTPFKRCQQQLIQDEEQKPVFSLDRIVVRDIKGEHHVFYFDISAPIIKERELYTKAWEDHLQGKPIDPQIKADFEQAADVQTGGSRIIRLRPNERYFGKPHLGGEDGGK